MSKLLPFQWLIIGGGMHGCHFANVLLDAGIPRERLAILDAESTPLGAWKKRRVATGMRFLRSPAVHHIGLDPFEIARRLEKLVIRTKADSINFGQKE